MGHKQLGRVIVLNGTSSAGKSTLSRALQETLPEPWWHVSMDAFTAMQPPARAVSSSDLQESALWNADLCLSLFLTGWYQCIRALALAGNNVIADAGFLKREWLIEQAEALDGISALFVGVFCPLAEVERRERDRGDRPTGYAREQYRLVHSFGTYDVTVDTSLISPEEAAQVVALALLDPPTPSVLATIHKAV